MISSQVSTREQALLAHRELFLDALQEFAPDAWAELNKFRVENPPYFDRWETHAHILKLEEEKPHSQDATFYLLNPDKLQARLRRYELSKGLQDWKDKYSIRDFWVMDYILDWFRHCQFYPYSDIKPSLVLGGSFMYTDHLDPPQLPVYEPQLVSRKRYLKEATEILKRYCDESEREALSNEMEMTKTPNPRAFEWLIRFHFGRERYEDITGKLKTGEETKSKSAVGEQITNLAARMSFTLRPSRGRPKKKE